MYKIPNLEQVVSMLHCPRLPASLGSVGLAVFGTWSIIMPPELMTAVVSVEDFASHSALSFAGMLLDCKQSINC